MVFYKSISSNLRVKNYSIGFRMHCNSLFKNTWFHKIVSRILDMFKTILHCRTLSRVMTMSLVVSIPLSLYVHSPISWLNYEDCPVSFKRIYPFSTMINFLNSRRVTILYRERTFCHFDSRLKLIVKICNVNFETREELA